MTQENIIELKAYFGKQQGATWLNPVRDVASNKLLGVRLLSPTEQLNAPKVVTADTTRRISDGMVLDLSDPVDAIDWEWIKHNKEISMSEEEAHSNPSCLFYVYQPDLQLDKDLEKFDTGFEATKIVKEASPEERRDLCLYLGIPVDSARDKDVLSYLKDRVQTDPGSILQAKDDPNFKDKLFLQRLIHNRVFRKDANGHIKYGDIIVGLTNEAAIGWLKQPKNRGLVGKLYTQVYGSPEIAEIGSVVEEFESLDSESKNKKAQTSGAAGKASKKEPAAKTEVESEEEVI